MKNFNKPKEFKLYYQPYELYLMYLMDDVKVIDLNNRCIYYYNTTIQKIIFVYNIPRSKLYYNQEEINLVLKFVYEIPFPGLPITIMFRSRYPKNPYVQNFGPFIDSAYEHFIEDNQIHLP